MKKIYYLGFLIALLFTNPTNTLADEAQVKVILSANIPNQEERTYGIYYRYSDMLAATLTTNFKKDVYCYLDAGLYTVKQISSKSVPITDNNVYVFITSIADTEYKIKLNPATTFGTLNIESMLETKETITPQENITYEIYNNKNLLLTKITTNKLGKESITLPTGNYTLKQITEIPNTYPTIDTPFEITNQEETNITLRNKKIETILKINSLDLERNAPLLRKDIIYRIYHKNGGNICLDNLCHFQTDEQGTLTIPFYLTKGEYTIRVLETSNLENYLWNNKNYDIKIDENTPEKLSLDIPFKRIKAHVNIKYFDELLKLEQDTFTYELKENKQDTLDIYTQEDITIGGHTFFKKGELVATYNLKNPKTLELELGKYTIKNANLKEDLDLIHKDSYNSFINVSKTVNAYLPKTTLELNIEDYPSKIVKIYTSSHKLIYTGTTDSKGFLKIDNIFTGNFYLIVEDEKIPFSITPDEKAVITIPKEETPTITDKTEEKEEEIDQIPIKPNTPPQDITLPNNPFTFDAIYIYLTTFIISLIPIIIIIKKKLRNSP